MNGCRIRDTPLVVDFWKIEELPPRRMLFFLTHMHAGRGPDAVALSLYDTLFVPLVLPDHTSGLSSSWPHKIHCTALTGELLKKKFDVDPKLVVRPTIGKPKTLSLLRLSHFFCMELNL